MMMLMIPGHVLTVPLPMNNLEALPENVVLILHHTLSFAKVVIVQPGFPEKCH